MMFPPRSAVRAGLAAITVGCTVFAFKLPVNGVVGSHNFWLCWFIISAVLCGIATLWPHRGPLIPFAGAFATLAFLSRAAGLLYSHALIPGWVAATTLWTLAAVLTFLLCCAIAIHIESS